MKLQIALDELSADEGIRLCQQAEDYIDIIEIGTPLLLREGLDAVRALRQAFPNKKILADAKIMDAGAAESAMCFEAGADYVTVLGVTDVLTVKACVDTARQCGGEIVADMICVKDLPERIAELEKAGVRNFAVHTGVDQQKAGRTPLQDLNEMRTCTPAAVISVAGGITSDTIEQYKAAGADIVIVGGAIAHAAEPAVTAQELAAKL